MQSEICPNFVCHVAVLILKYSMCDSQIYDKCYALLTGVPLPDEGFGRCQRNEQKQSQKYSSPHLVDAHTNLREVK